MPRVQQVTGMKAGFPGQRSRAAGALLQDLRPGAGPRCGGFGGGGGLEQKRARPSKGTWSLPLFVWQGEAWCSLFHFTQMEASASPERHSRAARSNRPEAFDTLKFDGFPP